VLPLSTAFYICEGMGWERGIDRNFREAPEFYTLYTAIIALGAGLILLPRAPLIPIMFWSQVLNGAMLPPVLVLMLFLINRRDLMGAWVNSRASNLVAWLTTIILIALTVILLFQMVFLRSG
jgi:Mn2+/Fe2+ NRAMP family transporter